MASKHRQWSSLSKASRDRATREAAEKYGLTRRQARERYNRGTWEPFARDPLKQVPQHSPRRPEIGPGFLPDLKARAMANMDRHLGNDFAYQAGRFDVLDTIENHASNDALILMAGASEDEIRSWARYNTNTRKGNYPPKWLERLGWRDADGNWNNIFWYH